MKTPLDALAAIRAQCNAALSHYGNNEFATLILNLTTQGMEAAKFPVVKVMAKDLRVGDWFKGPPHDTDPEWKTAVVLGLRGDVASVTMIIARPSTTTSGIVDQMTVKGDSMFEVERTGHALTPIQQHAEEMFDIIKAMQKNFSFDSLGQAYATIDCVVKAIEPPVPPTYDELVAALKIVHRTACSMTGKSGFIDTVIDTAHAILQRVPK